MQVFLFHQMGKLNSAALDRIQTDRETQTRLVSASSAAARMEVLHCKVPKTGRGGGGAAAEKGKGRDQYGLTITPVSAGSNGHPYCISPGWFSLKWPESF